MKAIALISGGLDSTLAVKLVQEQGIEITALNFKTPFCQCDRGLSGCASFSRKVAENLGIELKVVNVTDDFLKILLYPKHGYGSQMNPCIDCRILMFQKAREFMQGAGASFIISGEVLGQRPMSQHKRALREIEKESGLEGLILRPLSSRLLPETFPEKNRWVNRNKLLAFNGRARRPQMELAENFNIKDYPCAAGGCLLTDPEFAKRIKDLIRHQELSLNNIELLKVGRHFRFSKDSKLIVGRNKSENERLLFLAKENDYLFRPSEVNGPAAVGRGIFNEDLINLSCRIICRYSDADSMAEIICDRLPKNGQRILKVLPLADSELINFRI